MNILGIGGYSHDSAAALVCDGQLVAGVAEERLTRVKHQGGAPREAVAYCLEAAGLTRDDIDHVGCYMKPGYRMARRLAYRMRQIPRSPLYSAAYAGYELVHNAQYVRDMRGLCGRNARLHYMEHHPAHAASAYLVSPFDEAALLTIDYIGEWASTWFGIGEGTRIKTLGAVNYPHSLGVFYSAITDYLGFLRASDEYKVMGLAPYGEPEYYDDLKKIVCMNGRADYHIDLSWASWHYRPGSRHGYFSDKFLKRYGSPRKKGEEVEQRHKNMAASAQKLLEESVLQIARALQVETGSRNLCMAGGVALNCAMNGRLLREGPFESIYVQPASGDDGIALDAAGLDYETPADLEERSADLLAEGKIVGWYQGRMEFGPRALGSRSILADPTRADMKDRVNDVVKHRESFRPFAPSCLKERASEFFEGCADSPFMLFVYPVAEAHRGRLPAITHVDGTARVQTVDANLMPRYHKLISAFENRRGVPLVLNTSFNVMGEPIVNTPEDAVKCYLGTGIDALAIGDCLAVKKQT